MENTKLEILKENSLSSVLLREIERLIIDGAFASGERLNENALAARFQVSRGPVREAFRALAEKGLVKIIPNRGAFIRQVSRREAEECYELRAGLFSLAARLLAERITDEQLSQLSLLIEQMEAASERQSLEDYYPLNLKFHESILKFVGNKRLEADYFGLINEIHLFRERGLLHGGGLAVSNAEHREIVAALEARDVLKASEAACLHVLNAKRRMLAVPEEEPAAARA
ncbi:FCD domain-containing protein [Shinella sp.]|uniref:FCD domain-containing protein n=1 Tax=Shinella sp. TaxID=1870904 RepID=UPI003F6FB34F